MNVFVGIDVSKGRLDWAVHQSAEGSVPSCAPGIRRLVAKLQKPRPTRVAVESTGGYERYLVEALQEAGVPSPSSTPGAFAASAKGSACWPRPIPSTPASWPASPIGSGRRRAREGAPQSAR